MATNILPVIEFLDCATPQCWLDAAVEHQDILLIDHAHCEKKAASTALMLIHRYPTKSELLDKLSRLAREELRHFEQVLAIIRERKIKFRALSASRYAGALRAQVSAQEPARLVDTLIIGAIIEARSCERFAALAPYLDENLAKYYRFLLKSESRHYADYLSLARAYSAVNIEQRLALLLKKESELIVSADTQFRFHSGRYVVQLA